MIPLDKIRVDASDLEGIVNLGREVGGQALWSAAMSAYSWLTKRSPLEEEQLNRYHDLVTAYQRMNISIPRYWVLDEENRPKFELRYATLIRGLESYISKLKARNSEIYLARASMLTLILNYIQAISQGPSTWNYLLGNIIRPDGVEAMFFSEMIYWIEHEVPHLKDLDTETIDVFEKRARYCKEVYDVVILNSPSNLHKINPKDTLQRLTSMMERHHTNLVQHQEARTFNQLLNTLSDKLLGLSARSLNMMFLLNRKVKQPMLIVEQFLNPYESDTKINKMRQTELGEWLFETLDKFGIHTSTFASQHTFTHDEITQHLKGKCPNDKDCTLDLPLKHATARQWGHREFVTDTRAPGASSLSILSGLGSIDTAAQAQLNERANHYLEDIRKIYRLTLQLYFIRQNLVRTAQVANVFGEVWIYGDPVGRAVLDELLTIVSEVTESHHDVVTDFWKDYFVDGYMPHARAMREDHWPNPSHLWLNKIDSELMPGITKDVNSVMDTLGLIREQSGKLPQILERVKKIKKELFGDLLAILKHNGKDQTANYFIIKQALTEIEMNVEVGIEGGSIERAEFTIYKEAQKESSRQDKIKQGIELKMNEYIESQPEVIAAIQKHRQMEQNALKKQSEVSQTYTRLLSERMIAIRDAELAQKDTIKQLTAELHKEKLRAQHAALFTPWHKKQMVVEPDDDDSIVSEEIKTIHVNEMDRSAEELIRGAMKLSEIFMAIESSSAVDTSALISPQGMSGV